MKFARFSTDQTAGKMGGYVGEGHFTDDPLNTFGGAGVVDIPKMQKLITSVRTAQHPWRQNFLQLPARSTKPPPLSGMGYASARPA